MSQSKAAELFDLSQASYSKLEAGEVDVTVSTLAKAAEVTGIPVAGLLGIQTLPEPSLDAMLRAVLDAGYRVEKAAQPPRSEAEGSP